MVDILPRRRSEGPSEDPEVRELAREVNELKGRRVEEQLAALRERIERGRRDAEERDRATLGGPCVYCGRSRQHPEVSWKGNPGALFCAACDDDRWDHPDVEHRSLILNRILANDWSIRTFQVGKIAEMEIERCGFKWFCETPGAQPGGWDRWKYLGDLDAIRERAAGPPEPPPAPRFQAGDPCERCGCAYMWTTLPRHAEVAVGPNGNYVKDIPSGPGCGGCFGYESLDDVVRRIIGVWGKIRMPYEGGPGVFLLPTKSATELLGVTWYKDRTVSTAERSRQVTLAPFAYLDLQALRRRAFEYFPFQSEWTNHAAWQALAAEAQAAGESQHRHIPHNGRP